MTPGASPDLARSLMMAGVPMAEAANLARAPAAHRPPAPHRAPLICPGAILSRHDRDWLTESVARSRLRHVALIDRLRAAMDPRKPKEPNR
jgi:hypothetical protein